MPRFLMFGLFVLLAACVTATPYQPQANPRDYGYSETRIEENRYVVNFRGNFSTDRSAVENSLLYRAAELTVERGFDYFVVTNRDLDVTRRLQSIGPPVYAGFYPDYYYFGRFGWRYYRDPFFDRGVDVREIQRYEARTEIVMYRGAKPANDPAAFNAREVLANLGPRIQRPVAAQSTAR